jgi:hypothetical protein
MKKIFNYLRINYWRFTPDSWPNWYYYHKTNLRYKIDLWKLWGVLPWQNNSRCSICAGTGRHPKYGDECDHCGGKGHTPRWNESILSKMFKLIGLRIDNKIKKI